MSRADLACLIGLAVMYVVSREVMHGLGVDFDSGVIHEYWQVLPLDLLHREPWTSLWHLHAQPPLFNALIAVALRLEEWPHSVLAAGFAGAAVLTLMLLYVLLRWWRVPTWLAFSTTVAVAMNPSFVAFEHWAFYPALEALLLVAGAVAVTAWDRTSGRAATWCAGAFGLSIAALVLLRSLFHPAWAAVLALGIVGARARTGRDVRRAQVAWALLPFAVGVALMTKNAAIAGHFATSSWLGMNLANLVLPALPPRELERLEARGDISPLHRVGTFRPIERYRPFAAVIEPELRRPLPTGVAVLDVEQRQSRWPNYNHLWHAGISRVLLRDVQRVAREAPESVARRAREAALLFCQPTSGSKGVAGTVQRIWPLETWYRRVLYPGGSAALIASTLCAVTAWCVGRALIAARRPDQYAIDIGAAVFVATTVAWVSLVGSIGEFGENSRFRFSVDPLLVAVVVSAAAEVGRWATGRARPEPA